MSVKRSKVKRIKLDRQDDHVKEFFQKLPIEPVGIALELNGKVICKIIGPHQMTAAEQATFFEQRRELLRKARRRNKGVPAKVLEREIKDAVDEVRATKTVKAVYLHR